MVDVKMYKLLRDSQKGNTQHFLHIKVTSLVSFPATYEKHVEVN